VIRTIHSILFLSFTRLVCHGQSEDMVWIFGPGGAGVDFNHCPPTVLTNVPGSGVTFEGAVSISDRYTGALLFYTNGYRAYNADHVPMMNGDPVSLSNTMAQNIIIPRPGSLTHYYIVTPDVQAGLVLNSEYPSAYGINVAEVDMTLDEGLGAVTSKFIPLKPPPNCELLTAIRHANGSSFWLIGHEYGNDHFFVFEIDAAGISPIPTIYPVGPVVDTPQGGTAGASNWDAIGNIRATVDGTKLAFTTFYNGITALFDFDPWTGTVSHPIPLDIGAGGYGICFSPDGSKLYISTRDTAAYTVFMGGKILQFDVSSDDPASIQTSMTVIHAQIVGGCASLKLAPDGRIYSARTGSNGTSQGDDHLGVVNFPDQIGLQCGYVHDGLYLGGQFGSWSLNNLFETGNSCGNGQVFQHEYSGTQSMTVEVLNGRVFLSWPASTTYDKFTMTASDGRQLFQRAIPLSAYTLDVGSSSWAKGAYLITLHGPSERVSRVICITDH
jgi:hypothetical protein